MKTQTTELIIEGKSITLIYDDYTKRITIISDSIANIQGNIYGNVTGTIKGFISGNVNDIYGKILGKLFGNKIQ